MDDLTGQTVGQYRLVQKLGEGGMAEVYKAYQPRLDRYVAIKFIRPELAVDSHFRARFEHEARAIARLSHGNIVHIYDFGDEDKRYFLVMEFVEGQTLKDYLQKLHKIDQWVTIGRAVEITVQVAAALGYAHNQGIVHRDVKPDNVLLASNGRPVLNDFGIARMIEQEGQGLTQTGAAIGTPAYMAPEQIQGQKDKISAATDLYSLATILYELLTGRTPFTADTAFAVMLKHLSDPIPLPRQLNPQLGEALERFLLKALAKDPLDRFQTAEEFAQNLTIAAAQSDEAAVPATHLPPHAPSEQTQVAAEAEATVIESASGTVMPPIQKTAVSPPADPMLAPPTKRRRIPTWAWAVLGVLVVALVGAGLLNGLDDDPPPNQPPINLAEAGEQAEASAAEALPPGSAQGETIVFTTANGVFRVAAEPDAIPEPLAPYLDELFGEGEDYEVHISADGEWLLINTSRLEPECAGWSCLLRVRSDFSSAEGGIVYLPDYQVVHYNLGMAISPDGQQIVYSEGGGDNIIDLWLIEFEGELWSEPLLLTADSDYEFHGSPVFSPDGQTIAMLCGYDVDDNEYPENDVCRVDISGDEFGTAVYFTDGPIDMPEGENTLSTPHFLPDNILVFGTTWRSSILWRLNEEDESVVPLRMNPPVNDWLGCVLPSGRLATLQWREELNGPVLHVIDPSTQTDFFIETDEPLYYAIGCGGGD